MAEKIRLQTGPEDPMLTAVGMQNSLFRPEHPGAFSDFVREKQNIPKSNVNYGEMLIFEIDKQATFVEDLILRWDVDPIAVPGNGTYIRFQDFSFAQIEQIEIKFGSNNLYFVEPDDCWSNYHFMSDEKKESFENFHSGNLTQAERNTRAAAGQRFRFRLPMPWNDKRSNCPIISALANKIKIIIKTRIPALVLQSDGTKPSPLVMKSPTLEMQYLHTTSKERQEFTALTLKPNGLSYLIDEYEHKDVFVDTGAITSSGYVVDLNDFDGPITCVTVIVRPQSDLSQTSNDPNYYNIDTSIFEDWEYQLKAGTLVLFPRTEVNQELAYIMEKFYCASPDIEQLIAFWDELPKLQNCSSGHLNIGNVSSPKFTIFATTPNAVPLHLRFIAKRKNWWNHQAGNIQKIWN